MLKFLKRLMQGKFHDAELTISEMLKEKGKKIKGIYWQDSDMIRNWNNEPEHIYRASLFTIDLETKEPTTKDVANHGCIAYNIVNHFEEGTVTYNTKTGEIILKMKKRKGEEDDKHSKTNNSRNNKR